MKQRLAARQTSTGNVLPLTGSEPGNFETYLARIEALARTGADRFFVTIAETDGPRFIQVSAERDRAGRLTYQFDLPVLDWSAGTADRIEAEATKRGLACRRVPGPPMAFLDVDFETSGDHAVFARWVVTEVFRLPPDSRFEITWG
ncbi:MAG: hypothetical protein HKN98_01560 [Silicimonas sp.]|nr:hypothetical protein [Silicimonas sp.]NND17242.1 hypothetical protein [Silicimonas sp.]NNL34515.1 hypothetical protein [Silicimonas sp.]NNL74200.1 hypothetical protein [Silicimonas sp.]RZW00712.1 MAG: hypothetical protein EX266_13660 [Paracoccaceae bacterium]